MQVKIWNILPLLIFFSVGLSCQHMGTGEEPSKSDSISTITSFSTKEESPSKLSILYIIDGSGSMKRKSKDISLLVSRLKGRIEGQAASSDLKDTDVEHYTFLAKGKSLVPLTDNTNLSNLNLYTSAISPIPWMIDTLVSILYNNDSIKESQKKRGKISKIGILITDFYTTGMGVSHIYDAVRKIQYFLLKEKRNLRTILVFYPRSKLYLFILADQNISSILFPYHELASIFEFGERNSLRNPEVYDFYLLDNIKWALDHHNTTNKNNNDYVKVCEWNAHTYELTKHSVMKNKPYSLVFAIEAHGIWKKLFKYFEEKTKSQKFKEKLYNEMKTIEPKLHSDDFQISIEDTYPRIKVALGNSKKETLYPTVMVTVKTDLSTLNKSFKLSIPSSLLTPTVCADIFNPNNSKDVAQKHKEILAQYLCEVYLTASLNEKEKFTFNAKLVRKCRD